MKVISLVDLINFENERSISETVFSENNDSSYVKFMKKRRIKSLCLPILTIFVYSSTIFFSSLPSIDKNCSLF